MNSQEILRGLPTIYSVLSFQISKSVLKGVTGDIKILGLNCTKFYQEVYESRKDCEDELKQILETGDLSVWVVGPVGVGKTSIVYKGILDHAKKHELPFIVVDFDETELEEKVNNEHDPSEVYKLLYSEISTDIFKYVKSQDQNLTEISLCFFDSSNSEFIESADSRSRHRELSETFDRLQRHEPEEFSKLSLHDWVLGLYSGKFKTGHEESINRLEAFAIGMSEKDQLFAISQQTEKTVRRKAIILFDNLDAVKDRTIREHVRTWLESQCSKFKEVATFVMCIRPSNKAHFELNAEVPTNSEYSAPIFDIKVNGGNSEYDGQDEFFAASFDDRVHQKRISFLERIESEKFSKLSVKEKEVRACIEACNRIREEKTIYRDALELANQNRRDMLSAIVNFVEHLVKVEHIDWSELADKSEDGIARANSMLRSLFYKYLASHPKVGEKSSVFDVDLFDPIGWIENAGWQKKGKTELLEPTLVRKCPQHVYSMRFYYVLVAIYNITGARLNRYPKKSVTAQDLADYCEPIGLRLEDIQEVIHTFIRGPVRGRGLVESTRFNQIHSNSALLPNDEISITDRGCVLLSRTGFKFNYLANLCRRQELASKSVDAKGAEQSMANAVGIPPKEQVVRWLKKAITTEARIVETILQDHPSDGFDIYKDRFCHGTEGLLFCQRTLRSFLGHMRIEKRHSSPAKPHYQSMEHEFSAINESLKKKISSIGTGQFFPRNSPFEPS